MFVKRIFFSPHATPNRFAYFSIAEENTRESIFAGFRRKETYATSGTRIKLRFFGGFGLDELDLDDEGVIAKAYEKGVSTILWSEELLVISGLEIR